jgi:hypothetical protein
MNEWSASGGVFIESFIVRSRFQLLYCLMLMDSGHSGALIASRKLQLQLVEQANL